MLFANHLFFLFCLSWCNRPGGTDEVKHFPYRSGEIPKGFCLINIDNGNGGRLPICLEVSEDKLNSNDPGNPWIFHVENDFRISALVTIIKAAHLTLFSLFGYKYAISTTGLFVGQMILGKFYRDNKNDSKKIILKNAAKFFNEFRQIVRPASKIEQVVEGTLTSREILLCASSSGPPWGMVVFVKTGLLCNAVLLPFPDCPNALSIYHSFVKNDNSKIHVFEAKFNLEKEVWESNNNRIAINWPKDKECLIDGIFNGDNLAYYK